MRKTLDELIWRVKTYGDKITIEHLEELHAMTDEECPDCQPSYDQGVNIVIDNVLKNAKLKTRGEMIDAAKREFVTDAYEEDDGDVRKT